MLRWRLDGSNVEGSQQALCHFYEALMGLSAYRVRRSVNSCKSMRFYGNGETTKYLLLFARSYFVFGLKYQLRRAQLTAKYVPRMIWQLDYWLSPWRTSGKLKIQAILSASILDPFTRYNTNGFRDIFVSQCDWAFNQFWQASWGSLRIVESSKSRFVGPKTMSFQAFFGLSRMLHWRVKNVSLLLYSIISPLISHFEHGRFTLAQSIESLKIGQALETCKFELSTRALV